MMKKSTAHMGAIGRRDRASGYTIKAKPGPVNRVTQRMVNLIHILKLNYHNLNNINSVKLSHHALTGRGYINDEMLTSICHLRNRNVLFIRHETQNGENDKSGKHAGAAVDDANNHGVTIAVVLEFVIAGHGNETSGACAEGVENLSTGVAPDARFHQLVEVRLQVVDNPVRGPRKRHAPEHQHDQHQVGENSREVHNLTIKQG